MVLLKVKKSLRWHMQEVMSESFGTIVEELLFLKRSVGDFLGKKRCLNILKSWTDLLNSLFHLNLCQIWLIFHQTDLSTGIFIFKKINTQYHPMLSFRDAMMKSVSKGTYLYWFYNLRGYNIRVRLLFRSILHKNVFEDVFSCYCLFVLTMGTLREGKLNDNWNGLKPWVKLKKKKRINQREVIEHWWIWKKKLNQTTEQNA